MENLIYLFSSRNYDVYYCGDTGYIITYLHSGKAYRYINDESLTYVDAIQCKIILTEEKNIRIHTKEHSFYNNVQTELLLKTIKKLQDYDIYIINYN